ncbi:MAG: hypothetical protein E7K72_25060 [Roseomonas mucosa]|uniref:hypothetical protein n=1 Tax=Roseomonas mucosa TaxID=207340 RepID=UPI002245BFA7|nr:hypothetical protein [Roseomonas mucosa]MDU7524600.1 hypothetical protein [Roseomonas mucosa]UZO91813.1 Hypothetical protein RMP42_05964 [Roseomonas mucosa]
MARPRIHPPGTTAADRSRLARQRHVEVGSRQRVFVLPAEALEDLRLAREALGVPSDTAAVIEALRRLRLAARGGE